MRRADIPRDGNAVVGCYSVHLYCQHPNHDVDAMERAASIGGPGDVPDNPTERIGHTLGGVLARARNSGWYIGRRDEHGRRAVLCPYHAREVPR